MSMKYRNIFEFPPRWLFRCRPNRCLILAGATVHIIVVGISAAVVAVVLVLALGNRGPFVKHKTRTVITVRSTVLRVRVIVVRVRSSRSRGRYADPFLLPLPHRPREHRGRSVPSGGPSESGPNALHESTADLRWRLRSALGSKRVWIIEIFFLFGQKLKFGSLSLSLSQKTTLSLSL